MAVTCLRPPMREGSFKDACCGEHHGFDARALFGRFEAEIERV